MFLGILIVLSTEVMIARAQTRGRCAYSSLETIKPHWDLFNIQRKHHIYKYVKSFEYIHIGFRIHRNLIKQMVYAFDCVSVDSNFEIKSILCIFWFTFWQLCFCMGLHLYVAGWSVFKILKSEVKTTLLGKFENVCIE